MFAKEALYPGDADLTVDLAAAGGQDVRVLLTQPSQTKV
mgnify:CR=1 FL=1